MARPLEVIRHCCLVGTNLERADLRSMDLRGVNFTNSNLRGADLSHADCRGAIFVKAVLHWYWNPKGGIPSYDPKEGYVDLWHSVLGGISIQENAAARPK